MLAHGTCIRKKLHKRLEMQEGSSSLLLVSTMQFQVSFTLPSHFHLQSAPDLWIEAGNETKRSFCRQTSGVRNTAAWLHYDDATFCYIHMKMEYKERRSIRQVLNVTQSRDSA